MKHSISWSIMSLNTVQHFIQVSWADIFHCMDPEEPRSLCFNHFKAISDIPNNFKTFEIFSLILKCILEVVKRKKVISSQMSSSFQNNKQSLFLWVLYNLSSVCLIKIKTRGSRLSTTAVS